MVGIQSQGQSGGSHPESCLWSGQALWLRIGKDFSFSFKVNKHVVYQVTADVCCITPDHDLSSAASAENNREKVATSGYFIEKSAILCGKQMKYIVGEYFTDT